MIILQYKVHSIGLGYEFIAVWFGSFGPGMMPTIIMLIGFKRIDLGKFKITIKPLHYSKSGQKVETNHNSASELNCKDRKEMAYHHRPCILSTL